MDENRTLPTPQRRFKGDNIIWILILIILLYEFADSFFHLIVINLLLYLADWSPAMEFTISYYTACIADIIFLLFILVVVRKNRFIMRAFLPAGAESRLIGRMPEHTYCPTHNNTVKMLLIGLLLGFITNFTCIMCAVAHGDIKLVFDCSLSAVPVLLFALVSVFIQSTGEELWTRGFMYERICIHYPVWVAVLANGIFFGLMHCFNPGVSVLAVVGIAISGISYSLIRWYTGSIWVPMGIHTMWNFTQNFLFGLPNSGLVSEISLFRLDAANGISNLIYDFGFGVEAAIPAVIVDVALGIAVIFLAKRSGRLGELTMSYEKKAAQNG